MPPHTLTSTYPPPTPHLPLPQGSFGLFWINYYLTTMTGIVLAYGVASVVPTMDAANALLPTYVTFCLYFGGLFLNFDKIPPGWYWFSWTSFLRYSWGAHMLNQYQTRVTHGALCHTVHLP